MIKKTIAFTDYDGNKREEDWYFNLNKPETFELEASVDGGFDGLIEQIANDPKGSDIMRVFKDLIERSVGKKSDDGRKFIKNDKIREDFMQSEAYPELFTELVTEAGKAAEFINGILPSEEEIKEIVSKANSINAAEG